MKPTTEERFAQVKQLCGNQQENFIALGEALYEIKRTKAFRLRGYRSFKEFVEGEYGMSGGTASRLVNIYDTYVNERDMALADIDAIGFDRLQIVRPPVLEVSFNEGEEMRRYRREGAAAAREDGEGMNPSEKALAQKIRDCITKARQQLTKPQEVSHHDCKALTAAYGDGANAALDQVMRIITERAAQEFEDALKELHYKLACYFDMQDPDIIKEMTRLEQRRIEESFSGAGA